MADLREIAVARNQARKALRVVQGFNPASFSSIVDEDTRNRFISYVACLVNAFLRFSPDVLRELKVEDLHLLRELAATVGGELMAAAVVKEDIATLPVVSLRYQRHFSTLCKEVIPKLRSIEERNNSTQLADLRDLYKQAERNQEDFRRAEVSRAKDAEIATESLRRSVADMENKRQDAEAALKQARQIQKELEELRDKIGTMADNAQKKAEAAVAAAGASFREEAKYQHQTLAREGVNKQSAFFKQEAKRHEDASRNWGIGAAVAALLLLAYAIYGDRLIVNGFPTNPGNEWTPQLIYITMRGVITRLLIFAVLGYTLFFCAKNYMAHRHNAVVNRHRRNALASYRMLARASMDPGNADIILTQAARFIYAPQDSGYVRGGGVDGGDVSVFETVRRAADLAKKTNKDE